MSRAKIVFLPIDAIQNVELVEKYSGWSYNTSDYKEDGYIYTDNVSKIDDVNSKYWVRFKPVHGYKFTEVYKTYSSDSSNAGNFTIESDGSVIVYPWQNGTATIITNYLHFGVAESTSVTYQVTRDIENCSCDNLSEYNDGETVALHLQSNSDYIFKIAPVIEMNGVETPFVLSDDGTSASITFVITGNTIVKAHAVHKPYTLELNLENCTCNFEETIDAGRQKIILTANTGYVFNGYVTYKHGAITHSTDNYSLNDTVCEINLDVEYNIKITAKCIKQVKKLSKWANLYNVDTDILNQLSKVRFYKVSGESSEIIDYGTFITNLMNLPFELPESMIEDSANIQLGNYDSRIPAPIINDYTVTVELGSIDVPEKYFNVYDYKDTTCILHLPYCNSITLANEYVIGRLIVIKYKVDLYSGNCTVNIYSSFTGDIVASTNIKIGSKIPFIQEQNNTNVSSIETIIDNGVKQPFIEVVRNIPYNVDTIFGTETVDFGTLENYAGYIKVSDIILNISATNEDKNEIISLLENGVFINDINVL